MGPARISVVLITWKNAAFGLAEKCFWLSDCALDADNPRPGELLDRAGDLRLT
jgi:hypothetical protein